MDESSKWPWMAGLFEGEGTISFAGKTGVTVRVGMTDEDVIETLHRLYPTATTFRRELKNRSKPLYVWSVSSRDEVTTFLMGVWPYLHKRRRARTEEALHRLARNPGARPKRTHCLRGHPLSGDNLYVAKTGARSCKACRVARDRRRVR